MNHIHFVTSTVIIFVLAISVSSIPYNDAYGKRSLMNAVKFALDKYYQYNGYSNAYTGYVTPHGYGLGYFPQQTFSRDIDGDSQIEETVFKFKYNATDQVMVHLHDKLHTLCSHGEDTFSSQIVLSINPNQLMFYGLDIACGITNVDTNTFDETNNFENSEYRYMYLFNAEQPSVIFKTLKKFNDENCPEKRGVVAGVKFRVPSHTSNGTEVTLPIALTIAGCVTFYNG